MAPADEDDSDLRLKGILRAVIANQIADDNPPETWLTAQRLMDLGLTRELAMGQLAMTFADQFLAATGPEKRPYNAEEYLAALANLPLPTVPQIEQIYIELARERQPIPVIDLEFEVAARFRREPGDPIMRRLLDEVADQLVDENILDYLMEDRVIHPASLTTGITLTHRLTAGEIEAEVLILEGDLTPFACHMELRIEDGPLICSGEAGETAFWNMPQGWMEAFSEDQLLAASIIGDATARIEPLTAPPEASPSLVARILRIYQQQIAEDDMPVQLSDIVYELLVEDRSTFQLPRPPLDELCVQAGLERRGAMVAHDEELWDNLREFQRSARAWTMFNFDRELSQTAIQVLELADQPHPAPAELKKALNQLANEKVAQFVIDELTSLTAMDDERLSVAQEFASALTRAAGEGRPKAVAHWFAAVIAEQAEEPLVADAHLQVGLTAGRDWEPLLERAAWYASDRGDALAALSLVQRMHNPSEQAMDTLAPYAIAPQHSLGRNEPCWCGSGRKFKQCHLNQPAGHSLPDRVSWLCFKAVSYTEHQSSALDEILEIAQLRATDPNDDNSLAEALMDPLVMDLILTEGGWFEEFLADRGALLPEDEALLAQSWTLVDRSVYRVERTRPGEGVTVRDLASGDRLEVRERTFSRLAQAGWMICARAVPDGESNQFVGGIFVVKPGQEEQVLDLCAAGDPYELAAWAGALYRPPRMITREGEPMVSCTAVWRVADPVSARQILNTLFEPEEYGWLQTYMLGDDDKVIRAQLQLEGHLLTVTTASEERMDRVLDILESKLEGELVSDKREPFQPGPSASEPAGREEPAPELDPQMILQIQQSMEDRWMSEPVPALADLTPRQAAADPTRREQLERLLDSFEEMDDGLAGGITFRVDRLRKELGIEKSTGDVQ